MTSSLPTLTDLIVVFSVAFALVPVAALYVARWWLRRDAYEPPWAFPLLMLAGGGGGLLFALYGHGELVSLFARLYGPDAASEPLLYNGIVQPAAEEIGKAFIVLVFVLTPRFRGPVDGALYGLAAGVGFACVESFVHFYSAWAYQGAAGWLSEIAVRTGPSMVIHGTSTGAVGLFLGLAKLDRRAVVALLAPICGMTASLAVHGGWNALVFLSVYTGEADFERLAFMGQAPVMAVFVGALWWAVRLETRRGAPRPRSAGPAEAPHEGGGI
ncbi:MAG: PrsW family intramembrane metalloprotease [Myxococcales bacterium]|nr:PrsW family intramembrane metalloprotease [Myxococcales bacterium]